MADGTRRVLLVDDELSIVKTVGKRLEVAGFEVISAMDGQDALEKACSAHPDLIVLDLMLPKISGLKVCMTLKHDQVYQHIPIIIYTGKGQDIDEDACRKCGADAFVPKAQGMVSLLE